MWMTFLQNVILSMWQSTFLLQCVYSFKTSGKHLLKSCPVIRQKYMYVHLVKIDNLAELSSKHATFDVCQVKLTLSTKHVLFAIIIIDRCIILMLWFSDNGLGMTEYKSSIICTHKNNTSCVVVVAKFELYIVEQIFSGNC